MISTSYPRSSRDSAGVFIQSLVYALSASGVSLVVIAPGEQSSPPEQTEGTIRIFRVRYLGGTLAYGLGIFPNLRRYPWRVVQIPFLLCSMLAASIRLGRTTDIFHGQWAISGLVACLASAWCRKPFVVSIRGQDARLLQMPVVGLLFQLVLRRAGKVHVVSEPLRKLVESIIPATRVSLIVNGTNHPSGEILQAELGFKERHQLDANKNYLVFIGRRIELKGVPRLFQLLKNPSFASYELLCFGAGSLEYDEELYAAAERESVRDRLQLFPELPPFEVALAIGLATFVVSGSYSEGRPNGLLEGLALGKVCIASDIEAHRELAKECAAVIIFPLNDAAGIDFSGAFSPELPERAKSYAAQFTWAACAEHMKELYVSAAETTVKK